MNLDRFRRIVSKTFGRTMSTLKRVNKINDVKKSEIDIHITNFDKRKTTK